MRRTLWFILGVSGGVLGTIGGWWLLLSMLFRAFGFPDFLSSYTLFNLVLGAITLATLFTALALGGPYIIKDAVQNYRREEEGDEIWEE